MVLFCGLMRKGGFRTYDFFVTFYLHCYLHSGCLYVNVPLRLNPRGGGQTRIPAYQVLKGIS